MSQATSQPPRLYSTAEYFQIDSAPDVKFEFRDGELVDMAGGTESHSLIATNIAAVLVNSLQGKPCRVYGGDLRVRALRDVRYAYPDTFVVCGDRQFDPDAPKNTTVTNPTLIVEVLSPSTELTDRTEKFERFIKCESLKEYVLVSQHRPHVETYLRQDDRTWSFAFFDGLDAIARLRCLEIDLPLRSAYANVEFPPPDASGAVPQ